MRFKKTFFILLSNILMIAFVSVSISYCFFSGIYNQQKQQLEYIDQIEEELKILQKKEDSLQNEILELGTQVENLRSRLEFFYSTLDKNNEDINKLEEKITLLEARLENLRGKEPEFTETAPIYTRNKNYIEYFNLVSYGNPVVPFETYAEYCRTNFSECDLLLLTCIDHEYNCHPMMLKKYSVFCEKIENDIPKNVIFFEAFKMYSDVLGHTNDYLVGEGDMISSVDFEIFIKPLKEIGSLSSIILKFGEIQEDGYRKKYINIYLANECFATCFYEADVRVSIKWFADYFRNYFIFI